MGFFGGFLAAYSGFVLHNHHHFIDEIRNFRFKVPEIVRHYHDHHESEEHKPTPTPTPKYTYEHDRTEHWHHKKETPTPTPSPSPTPTPAPEVKIDDVLVNFCTTGSSCDGFLTNVEVNGENFAADSRVKLTNGGTEYTGNYMGGDGSTKIITDFLYLPHCTTFDAVVFGSTGTATSSGSVASQCP